MLRLTRLADYGVVILAHLARLGGVRASASEIAQATQLPAATVSKLVQALQQHGFLESARGAHGGYRLARAADEIRLGEVIAALDGGVALTDCNIEAARCAQAERCLTRRNWQRVNQALADALRELTIADMLDPDFVPQMRLERRAEVADG